MSRLIADARGLTFDLPQDQIGASMGLGAVRGGATQGSGKSLDPMSGLLEDELYQQEGLTDEYYKSVGALQRFVNEMSSAGYDVTKPDLTNPQSVQYYRMYQEAMADLHNKKNMLARGKTLEDMAIKDSNIKMQRNEGAEPTFSNTGANDITKQIWTSMNTANNEEELQQAVDMRDALIDMYMEELLVSKDPQEREEVRAQINILQGMNKGVGMTPYQQANLAQNEDQFRRRMAAERKTSGANPKRLARFETIQNALLSKDLTQLAAATGLDGAQIVDLPSGTYIQFEDSRGDVKRVPINPNNPSLAFKTVNGMINKSWDGSQLDSDDLFEAIREVGYDPDQAMSAILSQMDLAEDITTGAIEGLTKVFEASGGNLDVLEQLSSVIRNANGVMSPSGLTERAFKGGGVSIVNSIKPNRNFFSTNSLKVNITDPLDNKKDKPIELYPDKPEDVKLIRELIKSNIDEIPREILEELFGTKSAVQPGNDDRF
jgi:hypothetical protein